MTEMEEKIEQKLKRKIEKQADEIKLLKKQKVK